jgi:Tol biopolymer transport system component
MTARNDFDGVLTDWLDDQAGRGAPDYLDEILVRTTGTRQRPAWSSLERWLPMQATARLAPAFPRLTWIVVAVALILAAVAAVILAGVGRTALPAPFGPARNGAYAVGADGDLYRLDPATGQQTPLVTGPTWDFGAAFSRDGTRFAFGRLEGDPSKAPPGVDLGMTVMIANADGSNAREVTPATYGNCWSDWSPDGHHFVFRTERPDHVGILNVLDVDTGTFRTIDPGISVRCGALAYRPPNGAEIVFRGDTPTDHGVFTIHPDGSSLRRVATCDCDAGLVSPDGRTMAVDRWDSNGFVRLWLLDLDTGTERQLPMPDDHFARGGTFSPDGSLVAFPMLHRKAPSWNAYQVAIAPLHGAEPVRAIGPEMTLPPTGTDEAFVSITFAPDGRSVIAAYPDTPTSTTNTIWLLPLDGTPGRTVGRGTFASLDIQRRAP